MVGSSTITMCRRIPYSSRTSKRTVTKAPNNHQGILGAIPPNDPTWRKWQDDEKKEKKKRNKSAADVLYFTLHSVWRMEIKSGCDPIRVVLLLLQFDVSMETFLPKQRKTKGCSKKRRALFLMRSNRLKTIGN